MFKPERWWTRTKKKTIGKQTLKVPLYTAANTCAKDNELVELPVLESYR